MPKNSFFIYKFAPKMKDFSLFMLKNAFGAKMKKGFKNFCNNDTSTSTLNQNKVHHGGPSSTDSTAVERPFVRSPLGGIHPTLEEMILKLEMEENLAMRLKGDDQFFQHRRSCVNSSDILRSARNALNQYPRFSLDGKDSMYRSSFTNSPASRFPDEVAGESVVWCNPGVVARLMGIDAIPIPVNMKSSSKSNRRERLSGIIKRQNLRRIAAEQHELEKKRSMLAADSDNPYNFATKRSGLGDEEKTELIT